MARERTDWAEDRTLLAAERTFAGWMRTGLTMIVVSLALEGLFGPVEPLWLPKSIATSFLLGAVAAFLIGWHEGRRTRLNLTAHGVEVQSSRSQTLLTMLMVAATGGTGVVLWLL